MCHNSLGSLAVYHSYRRFLRNLILSLFFHFYLKNILIQALNTCYKGCDIFFVRMRRFLLTFDTIDILNIVY